MKQGLIAIVVLSYFAMVLTKKKNMPYIQSASYNDQLKAIQLMIQYGGGCREHTFQLKIGSCYETMPLQCEEVQLIDLANDGCEKLIRKMVTISLQEAGLDKEDYRGALLKIHGDRNSVVTITLPR